MSNLSIILKQRPGPNYPQVNDIYENKITSFPVLQNLKQGEVILRTLYLSIDAAMRVWIGPKPSYFKPVMPGDIMPALGVGQVIGSKSDKLKVGDYVTGFLLWQQLSVVSDKVLKKIDQSFPIYHQLGVLGISGLSAWVGLDDIAQTQSSDIVVVSAAAGGVGQLAIQLAKYHYKCPLVIGIAGGKEKSQLVVSLGADHCIDYQTENIEKRLKQIAPNGIDVYFDNVGGEQLDAVLMNIRDNSRIALCGAISQYNDQLYPLKNMPRLIIKKARMQGFIYMDYHKSFAKGRAVLENLLKNNQIKANYEFQNGLEEAPLALQKLQLGKNKAKLIVKVWKDGEWEKFSTQAKL